ncbi:hypothetical protein Vadar_033794 [Vaccinium darrowii]|uniref:Uncharacterized protein n=1 Tax=Vaccinium darrowii TaxID=229202 RepID=A0ACB7YJY2_9ERIC|nr:hypothetical protein Vadar_033794 [Vaccinium darrowii]
MKLEPVMRIQSQWSGTVGARVKLKNQPKWFLECERKNQIKRPTTGSPELEIVSDDNAEIDNVVDLERPTGIKAAKKAKINPKNRDDEPNSTPDSTQISGALDVIKVAKTKFVDKKVEMLEKAYAQEEEKIGIKKEMMEKEQSREQEKLRIKKEKLEMEQFIKEERIMLMDLSRLSKDQQEFYKNRQMEILVKSRRI